MIRRMALTAMALLLAFPAWADKQSDRKAFIQKLINRGIFQKVEVPGNLPHLWVKPAFHALDFDTKKLSVNYVDVHWHFAERDDGGG